MIIYLNEKRLENIQGLRFIAAGLVLFTHITFYVNTRFDSLFPVWEPGAAGVSLFFVISGFVICLSTKRIDFNMETAANFMRQRLFRIFPMYWLITTIKLFLIFTLPVTLIKNQGDIGYIIQSYFLFPVLNSQGKMEPLHGVGWSLIHEMYFYYVFAIGMLLRLSPVVFSSAVIIGLCLIGKLIDADGALLVVISSEKNLLFVVGMWIALYYSKGVRLNNLKSICIFLAGMIVMLCEPIRNFWFQLFRHFDIGAVLVVIGAMSLKLKFNEIIKRKLVSVGDSSYSVYLIHPIIAPAIVMILFEFKIFPIEMIIFATWMSCIIMGELVFLYIENPINKKIRSIAAVKTSERS
jgi:exopolysaccharide production protein ExoZ